MPISQPSGPTSSRISFSQRRRCRAAESRWIQLSAPCPGVDASACIVLRFRAIRLTLDLGPGLLPGVVGHAVVLAVAAIGDGRLPELDLREVLRVGIGMQRGAELAEDR